MSSSFLRISLKRAAHSRFFSIDSTIAAAQSDRFFKQQAYINGKWVEAHSGAKFNVTDPASGKVLGQVPDMDNKDTTAAIAAAKSALPAWRAMTASARGALLERWHDIVLESTEPLAVIMTAECGKPISEARGEVGYGASFLKWFAEEGKRAYGDVIPFDNPSRRLMTIKQPVGVCALVTPWNFPNAMITRKAGPALAAGCTVVVKPAEDTPFSALALAQAAEEAGIPPGVINVVTASRQNSPAVGNALCESPDVRKMSFTGSTPVGQHLAALCAGTTKRVSLELGGNAPFIVFDDADLDAAVVGAMGSKFRNTGQTCVCANRFLVQASVYDAFAAKLQAAVSAMEQGHGLDAGRPAQGPLINNAAVDKVESHVDDAVAKGATVIAGGSRNAALGGNFFEATVLTGVTTAMRVATEETFGPVAALFKFETEEEAVALANDTSAGLAAYFYSRDIGRVLRVSEALEYGMVGANEGLISTVVAPFGGIKESGTGREGSRSGINEYMDEKYICLGGI